MGPFARDVNLDLGLPVSMWSAILRGSMAAASARISTMITVNESAPCGGKTVYGATLGILMLETEFPRVHGDVGNAATFPFQFSTR